MSNSKKPRANSMDNNTENVDTAVRNRIPLRPAPMRLPFAPRRKPTIGEWVYRKRVGLLAMVLAYLIMGILFLSYKIVVQPAVPPTIAIEIVQEQIEEIEKEKLEQQIEQESERVSYEEVANKRSNDDSDLDASLADDRHQNNDIYEEAQRVQQDMQQSQNAYNQAMSELSSDTKKPRDKPVDRSAQKSDKNQRAQVKGNVTVRYFLKDRNDTYLHIPAYECRGGGEVVVQITVNNNGDVISASIARSSKETDDCVRNMALQAAKASSFNTSQSAPNKQKGTITYIFMPQ